MDTDLFVDGKRVGADSLHTELALACGLAFSRGLVLAVALWGRFRHWGFRPVRRQALYRAKDASMEQRAAFLASVRELGRRGA